MTPYDCMNWLTLVGPTGALANGKFTSLVFARSIKESIFFHHLSMKLRDEHMDLDDIAAAYCQQQGIAITDPDPNQLKKAKIHHLVNSTVDHFRQFSNTSLQEAQDKIRQLEAQLAATQTISQVPTDEEQAASPQPHPPTTPDEAPPSPTPARKRKPDTSNTQTAKRSRTLTDMGITKRPGNHDTKDTQRTRKHTTSPTAVPAAGAHDVPTSTTIGDLQAKITQLPGTNTVRPFASASPNNSTAKTVDAWIKKQSIPKQHQAALQEALATLTGLLKKIPKPEQSTFADKAASLGLPVSVASKARADELYKLLLFGVTQLE